MLNPNAKLNPKTFLPDIEQLPFAFFLFIALFFSLTSIASAATYVSGTLSADFGGATAE